MIIIKTPQPDAEERLVLVPVRRIVPESRDATPDDLARAGYVPRAMLTPDERTLCAESELDAEREETRHLRIRLSEQHERAEKAERERDDARRLHSAAEAQVACRSELRAERSEWATRAYAAERERDTLRAELARLTVVGEGEPTAVMSSGLTEATELELMRIVDGSIGRLDDVGTMLVTRSSASGAAHTVALDAYRLGAAHERARHGEPRATDEDLVGVYTHGYDAHANETRDPLSRSHYDCKRAAVAAVAARVRQERCLVAQAVGTNVDIRVCEDDGGGFMVGVHAPGCDEELTRCVPPADVPATLARLLGEVAK